MTLSLCNTQGKRGVRDPGKTKAKSRGRVTIEGRKKGTDGVKEKASVYQWGFGGLLLFDSPA